MGNIDEINHGGRILPVPTLTMKTRETVRMFIFGSERSFVQWCRALLASKAVLVPGTVHRMHTLLRDNCC